MEIAIKKLKMIQAFDNTGKDICRIRIWFWAGWGRSLYSEDICVEQEFDFEQVGVTASLWKSQSFTEDSLIINASINCIIKSEHFKGKLFWTCLNPKPLHVAGLSLCYYVVWCSLFSCFFS